MVLKSDKWEFVQIINLNFYLFLLVKMKTYKGFL